MAIKDKLLFQVELLPPSTGSVKKVSQVLDQATGSQRQFNKAQEQSSQQAREVEQQLDKYDRKLRELREGMKRAEEGARFFDGSVDKATASLDEQVNEAVRLRNQIDALEEQVDKTGASYKKFQRIQSRATNAIKGGKLSFGRVESGFKGMHQTATQANQTLMDFGRIVQDAPFGAIGISNNLDPLAMSFRRLKNSSNGVGGAFKALASKMMGTGGLIFLLGSVLPTALIMAKQGMIGFGDETKNTTDKIKDADESVQSLLTEIGKFQSFGDVDPLSVNKMIDKFEALRKEFGGLLEVQHNIEEATEDVAENAEVINSRFGMVVDQSRKFNAEATKQKNSFENILDSIQDQADLSDSQVDFLIEQNDELQKQIEKREALEKLFPEFKVQREVSENVEKAITRYENGLTVGIQRLEEVRKSLIKRRDEAFDKAFQGDETALKQLDFFNNKLDKLNKKIQESKIEDGFSNLQEDINKLNRSLEEDALGDLTLGLSIEPPDFSEETKEAKKLAKRRAKFREQLSDRTFKIQKDLSGDLISLRLSTTRQLRDISERANELDLQGTKEVEQMKTAIMRRHNKERQKIMLQNRQDIANSYMGVASHVANFMGELNGALKEKSKGLALAQLAFQKGQKIAEVVMEASSKVFKLNAQASEAEAQAKMAFAKSLTPSPMSLVHASRATALESAAKSARAKAGRISALAGTTVGLIGATTLAQGAGILSGGSGGSGGGSSSAGGGARAGFVTDEREKSESDKRKEQQADSNVSRKGRDIDKDQPINIHLSGDISDKSISIRAERGRNRRETRSISVGD